MDVNELMWHKAVSSVEWPSPFMAAHGAQNPFTPTLLLLC